MSKTFLYRTRIYRSGELIHIQNEIPPKKLASWVSELAIQEGSVLVIDKVTYEDFSGLPVAEMYETVTVKVFGAKHPYRTRTAKKPRKK